MPDSPDCCCCQRERGTLRLLLDVLAVISAGHLDVIVPATLPQPPYLDDAANLIDAIIHDALHAARPTWSEHGLRVHTARLINALSRRDLERIYRLYLSKRPPPLTNAAC